MKTELNPTESLKAEARANLQRGPEAVGGHLYLTDLRLIFEPHAVNLQRPAVIIELSDIASVEPAWTKLLNLIPVLPNALKVSSTTGEEHRFLVSDRRQWVTDITTASKDHSAG